MECLGDVVESKNVTGNLSSFFRRPAGKYSDGDDAARLRHFPAVEIIATHAVLTTMPRVNLLTQVATKVAALLSLFN